MKELSGWFKEREDPNEWLGWICRTQHLHVHVNIFTCGNKNVLQLSSTRFIQTWNIHVACPVFILDPIQQTNYSGLRREILPEFHNRSH